MMKVLNVPPFAPRTSFLRKLNPDLSAKDLNFRRKFEDDFSQKNRALCSRVSQVSE